MCECMGKGGKYRPFVSISEAEKIALAKRLPQVLQNRKKILAKQLVKNIQNTADTVFLNGKIYTMKQKNQIPIVVEAVATQGQNIIFVGSYLNVLPLIRNDTQVIDLDGRIMLPGFVEPHVHMTTQVAGSWIDFSPFTNGSIFEIKQKLIAAIRSVTVEGTWIMAKLYDPTITPNPDNIQFNVLKTGLAQMIKIQKMEHMKICIYIMEANGHIAYINQNAIQAAGLKNQSQILYGQYVKDENGELTGQLRQSAVFAITQVIPPPDEYKKNFLNFLKHSASKGVTTLSDGGIGSMDQGDLTVLNEVLSPQQNPLVRYSGFLVNTKWDRWQSLKLQPDYKDPLLRIRGIKCFCDGSIQGGSGYMREPYLDQKFGYGAANYTLKQLVFSIYEANKRGWQVAVHGNGDAGIDRILDAFEINQKLNPDWNHTLRNRIQHCTIVNYDQLQKMKQLQVYPSFLIGHIYYYGKVFIDMLGVKRASLTDPVRHAVELGLRPTLHSDHGCQPIDPIRCIYNAVTRIIRYTDDKVMNQYQCIAPYEALKAVTIDAAWQCHFDDIVGTIQVNKKADFVILDRDPLTIDPKQLIDLKIVQTWMNGRITFKTMDLKADNFAALLKSLQKKKHQPVEPKKEEKHEHVEHPKMEEKHQHVHPKKDEKHQHVHSKKDETHHH